MNDTNKDADKEIGIPVIAAVIYAGYKIDRRYHNEIHTALVAKGAR